MDELTQTIRDTGFAFVRSDAMRAALAAHGAPADWDAFAASWDDLGQDTYMADGGRYRKRRHAVFRVFPDSWERLPAQPHYQSRDYNQLNGGIERWFQPILPTVASGSAMTAVLRFCATLFGALTPAASWFVEAHQFRIEARTGEAGRPTPEGMHSDGVDHVLVLMVRRSNVRSGTTSVHDLSGRMLGSFTLTEPLDAALVEDRRVMHGVTPVEPVDPASVGFRDVLVVTFKQER
ncbi:MAG: 2OG-Fe dioxygenase family protein [Rhodospirillales bacterium]|jgi:hypothetical protein